MIRRLLFVGIVGVMMSCSSNQQKKQSNPQAQALEKIPVIFDTDANNELDDQHALAYLFMNREVFDILGVTTNATPNGGEIEEHTAEARRIFQLFNIDSSIPLISGANENFIDIKENFKNAEFDGSKAVDFIISEAKKYENHELVLLPVGKLTNIALAVKKAPEIKKNVKIVWLGSNYPGIGEYNQESDTAAMSYLLEQQVPFEMVTVRYGEKTGTAAVYVTHNEVAKYMPGMGPVVDKQVTGRHGGTFNNFGTYSMNLFEHAQFYGTPPHRSLFDMVAVAILKNPDWGESKTIPAPKLKDNIWHEQPNNQRKIIIWENFKKDAILNDFYTVMHGSTNNEND